MPEHTPILLLHGMDDWSGRFEKMRRGLVAHGLGPIEAMDFHPRDGSITIEAMGEQVQAAVEQTLQSHNAQKLDIVGFSMGALVARYFIQRMDGGGQVRRFVSISGPQHGTYTAFLPFWRASVPQMRPKSDLLRDLNSDPDPWGSIQVYSFWTPLDLTIQPPKSAYLEGSVARTFPVVLHPLMIVSPGVIEAVAEALSE
jgi:triacylglycerol lipase